VDPLDLVTLKIELEFGAAPRGETLPPSTTNADAQPRLLVSRFRDGEALFFRHDVPEPTRQSLRQLGVERSLTDEQVAAAILARDAPLRNIWGIRWYTVARLPDPREYAGVTTQDGRHVIVVDNQPVAWAWDTQSGPTAVEVEVETLPDHRRRGYARQVVAAWAARTLANGKIGFYSHLADNHPSAALARSLGLAWLSDEVEYL